MRGVLLGFVALAFPANLPAEEPPAGAFRTSGTAIVLSPDGTRAAVRLADGIDVLNLDTGAVVAKLRDEKKLKHPRNVQGPEWFTFAFVSGGKELVTATNARDVWVWDTETGKALRSIPGPTREQFTADGTKKRLSTWVKRVFNCPLADFVICETWDCGWQKLDPKAGKWVALTGGYNHISDVSPDGRWVTEYTDAASIENYVGVVDTKADKMVYDGASGGSYPFTSTPSPDGKLVACTTDEAGPQVWDVATGKEIKLKGVKPKVRYGGPRFTPDGKVVIVNMPASIYDKETPPHFARWDVASGERLADWKVPARITSWAVDHKNNRLVVIAGEKVHRIDLATGKFANMP